MEFSNVLKELRDYNNISQKKLADELGLTDRAIRKYESGESQPTLSVLIKLSYFFDVSLDYLAGLTDNPKRY